MKNIILVVVCMFVTITFANAQGNSAEAKDKNASLTNEQLATKRVDGFIKKFAFPAQLKEKLYPIFLERIKAVRQAKALTPPDKNALQVANRKFKSSIEQVLTPEQFALVKKAWEERKAKQGKGKKGEDGNELED